MPCVKYRIELLDPGFRLEYEDACLMNKLIIQRKVLTGSVDVYQSKSLVEDVIPRFKHTIAQAFLPERFDRA